MEKMNPEIKALWIAALKSGDYPKTAGRLARLDESGSVGYCCLGVLMELGAKEGVCHGMEIGSPNPYVTTVQPYYPGSNYAEDHWSYQVTMPTREVHKWANLDYEAADFLTYLNDSNTTFAPVIEYIDINL
ncbi:MAG TPA: hypothetical protein VIY48_00030 [Candidatus Paceibacterota bacterium]